MSSSSELENVDIDNGDFDWLAGVMRTLARAREGLKKAKETSLTMRGNLPTLVLFDITCCVCKEKGQYSYKCMKVKFESLETQWDDDVDEEVLMEESFLINIVIPLSLQRLKLYLHALI